jgi:hypothetical protein
LYGGGPNRLYNQFYAAIESWGRYGLVATAGEADLILEVSFSNVFVGEHDSGGTGHQQVLTKELFDPQFRLVVRDLATRVILWVFVAHVEPARLQGNRDKNFDQALAGLVSALRNVAGQSPTATSTNK